MDTMMPEPLSTVATSYGLATAVAKHAIAFWHWIRRRPAGDATYRVPHTGFELVPESFRVLLDAQIPEVTVLFRGVNYTRKPIELTAASVYQLLLPNGPSLDSIVLSGRYDLPAHSSSTIISFRRGLVDAEVRAVIAASLSDTADASVGYSGRARHGRTEYRYDPPGGQVIRGLIQGRPTGTAPVPKQSVEAIAAPAPTKPDERMIVADLSLPAEQAGRVTQLIQSERDNAMLWEFRYLNLFLANTTQLLLNYFVIQVAPVSVGLLDNQLQVFIPDANERNAITGALFQHWLIVMNNGFVEVTAKGRSYANWDGRRRPTPPSGVVLPPGLFAPPNGGAS